MISLSDSQPVGLSDSDKLALPASSPIQACPACEALIDITQWEPLDQIPCSECGGAIKVHGQVAHYRIIDVAGKGGMGVVYKAYDSVLDRFVAVKLLRKDHSDQGDLINQLEGEAAITASVNHPHVVNVFSTGTDRSRFFIAMELVNAGSLDDLIRIQGRVAESQVLEVGLQIARGLRAAQQHGLLHRDVKPGNILFADAHTAKVVDFGLAIFIDQEESVRGEVWGTPYYVAPEKLDSMPEDHRSDIYSLGASLFHALAGRPPFEAETATMVALKHLKSIPMSISTFAPWVSGATAFIINKTLLKDPGERYQSYDELIEHLEYALDEVHRAAQEQQPRARMVLETDEDKKRSGWLVAGMLALCAVLIGGFLVMQHQTAKERAANDAAVTTKAAATVAPVISDRARALRAFAFPTEISWLAAGNPKAAESFRAAVRRGNVSPENRAWAALLEGAAEIVAGRAAPAREAFEKMRTAAKDISNAKLAEFMIQTADELVKDGGVSPERAKRIDSSSSEAVFLLLAGTKNWSLGEIENGTAMLRKFRSANPAGEAAWLSELKPLASSFIGQVTALQMSVDRFQAAKTNSERARIAAALGQIEGSLAQRARDAIKPFREQLATYEATMKNLPPPGFYTIVNRKSGKVMEIDPGGPGDGTLERSNVRQWENSNQPNQQWELAPNGDWAFRFVPQNSKMSFDLPDSQSGDGVSLSQWSDNDTDAQRWQLEPANEPGFWKIVSAASGKVVGVNSGSLENGADIIQWEDLGAEDQQWKFVPVAPLPGGWNIREMGPVRRGTRVTRDEAGQGFTVQTAGIDIWGTADSGGFLEREMAGDFELVARVSILNANHERAKVGLMVREGLGAGARNVFLNVRYQRGLSRQVRPGHAAESVSNSDHELSGPRWLKLVRQGDRISCFHSLDGKAWVAFGEDTLAGLPERTFVGLAATSHIETEYMTGAFTNVALRAP
ncbi:MAG: RICIN domain-containing protein [Chthoniobacteraceae bacterium]